MCFQILNNNNVIINNIEYNINKIFFHLNINNLIKFINYINSKISIIKQSFKIDNYIDDLNLLFDYSKKIYCYYIDNNINDSYNDSLLFNEIFNNIIDVKELKNIKQDLYIIKFNLAYAFILKTYNPIDLTDLLKDI